MKGNILLVLLFSLSISVSAQENHGEIVWINMLLSAMDELLPEDCRLIKIDGDIREYLSPIRSYLGGGEELLDFYYTMYVLRGDTIISYGFVTVSGTPMSSPGADRVARIISESHIETYTKLMYGEFSRLGIEPFYYSEKDLITKWQYKGYIVVLSFLSSFENGRYYHTVLMQVMRQP